MRIKRLLVIGLIALLSACSGAPFFDEAEIEEKEKEPEAAVNLTFFSVDTMPNYEMMRSPIGQVIRDRTGVYIDISFPMGDSKHRIDMMLNGGEFPDLIYPKEYSSQLVDAGVMLNLEPLVEKYGPNIKKLYGDNWERMRWSKEDRSIYFLGAYPADNVKDEPSTGFQLQHAVVKELGYPRIRTLQDFEQAIKAYMDKHPTIDGKPTIGLSLLADDWRFLITVTNPAVQATGAPDGGEWYVDPETYEAVYHYRRPIEREYFRWLNHMNDIGLLDRESFVQGLDQYLAKIASGRVLALTDASWQYGEAELVLKETGKPERTYGTYPVTIDEDTLHHDFQRSVFDGLWGIGITKTAANPVKAIQFLDYLASEEGQILVNWGIEGIHYEIVDGKRRMFDDVKDKLMNEPLYKKKEGLGVYLYPFPYYGNLALDSGGQPYTAISKQDIADAYSPVEKEVLAEYGAKMWMDLFPSASSMPEIPYGAAWQISFDGSSEAHAIYQKCWEIMKKRVTEAILTDPQQFDAVWDAFMSELEAAGVERMEAEFNRILQNRLEEWGVK